MCVDIHTTDMQQPLQRGPAQRLPGRSRSGYGLGMRDCVLSSIHHACRSIESGLIPHALLTCALPTQTNRFGRPRHARRQSQNPSASATPAPCPSASRLHRVSVHVKCVRVGMSGRSFDQANRPPNRSIDPTECVITPTVHSNPRQHTHRPPSSSTTQPNHTPSTTSQP